jgi:hypothetical protein
MVKIGDVIKKTSRTISWQGDEHICYAYEIVGTRFKESLDGIDRTSKKFENTIMFTANVKVNNITMAFDISTRLGEGGIGFIASSGKYIDSCGDNRMQFYIEEPGLLNRILQLQDEVMKDIYPECLEDTNENQ